MATGYDPRVTRPLNVKRVIAAGERMLSEHQISPDQRAQIESNLARLRAELADEPKRRSRV
jgi:hypothetical protein